MAKTVKSGRRWLRGDPVWLARTTLAGASTVALLTACGVPGAAGSPAAGPSSAPSASAQPVSSVSASASAAASGSAPAAAAGCRSAGLKLTVSSSGTAAAGSYYALLELTNTSAAACTLLGFPGVSFVTSPSGRQIGVPAHRSAAHRPAVTLAPGAIAHATLQVTDVQVFPHAVCHPVTAHLLRVFPPGQVAPLFARYTALTCAAPKDPPGGYALIINPVMPGKGTLGRI